MNSKSYTKDDLKKLMQERKQEKLNTKKIDSPLANYDKNGNLYCKICELKIDNSNFWTKHLVSREHKSVIERLKNQSLNDKKRKLEDNQNDEIKNKQQKSNNNELDKNLNDSLNNNSNNNQNNLNNQEKLNKNQNNQSESLKGDLPKGFFDDPEEDAKARDEIFKDPLDDEFAKFQKTIQEEDKVAEIITESDLVEEQNYRELNEIDEQFEHWKRINDLEIKREEKKLRINKMEIDKKDNSKDNELSDEDEDEDLEDEFNILSNWRSKKAI